MRHSAPPGFHPPRRNRLQQEYVHDAYQAKHKLHQPSVCPQCGVVFHEGRWQWGKPPEGALQETCPACHRIHDHYPAGYLTLQGDFFTEHRDEIMNLLHNTEVRERAEHPLQRIMDEEEKTGETLVSTTDPHLARSMGEALHHAYQGKLHFHYNPEENLLRVNWSR